MTSNPQIYPRRASAGKGVVEGQLRTVGHTEPPTDLLE